MAPYPPSPFGHFSQRSMKLGSYIYIVNHALYNMVYEHDRWDDALSNWASVGGIFGAFAAITFWMVERLRSILRMGYNLINLNYLKLSREMEYHADLVAVSVSGNASFQNALRKIEFTASAYDVTLEQLNVLSTKEKASTNLYDNHTATIHYMAQQFDLGNQLNLMEPQFKAYFAKPPFETLVDYVEHDEAKTELRKYITEDIRHIKIAVFTPEDFLALYNLVALVADTMDAQQGLCLKALTDFQLTLPTPEVIASKTAQ